jgi:hypothetical protein
MVVPMAIVGRMAVPVVEVVDMVAVRNGDVPAAFPMGVIVIGVLDVVLGGALVEVPLMGGVKVAVVEVIDVVAVRDGYVPAAFTVDMTVVWVLNVGGAHGCPSWECRIASLTM